MAYILVLCNVNALALSHAMLSYYLSPSESCVICVGSLASLHEKLQTNLPGIFEKGWKLGPA